MPESELHERYCPACGLLTIHEYPVFGSWPSDYGRFNPPCRSAA